MDVEIKIPKRLYDDIEQYCKPNQMSVEWYCISVLRKQIALDKYGDLNEKFSAKKEEEPKVTVLESKPIVKPEVKEVPEVKVEIPEEIPQDKEERKHRTIQTK